MLDVLIIGAGVIGCGVAYRLSQFNLQVAVLEKENDVAMGTTRANSAIVHAGYDPEPGTKMARLNVRGNALVQRQCRELHVQCHNIGSLVLAFTEAEMRTVEKLYHNGVANGVPALEILDAKQLHAMEPNVSDEALGALYAPTACVIEPWDYALAMAQVAAQNGVQFTFDAAVSKVTPLAEGWCVTTADGRNVEARYVVNAAGVQADVVTGMAADASFHTVPSRGEYYLLDKNQGTLVHHVIFQCPNENGKGVLVSPTIHGNLIVGPNAESSTREDTATTPEGLAFVKEKAVKSVPSISFRENIRNFAGVRANTDQSDFVIEQSAPGFITLGGIKSPGLSSAPAIAEEAEVLLRTAGLVCEPKSGAVTTRDKKVFHRMSEADKKKAIAANPLYGRVICRCETITEGEIVDALHAPLPPHTIDGVKRRCGAGMGRCQGGFCGPRVHEIIARELGIPQQQVQKDKNGSYIIVSETKGGGAQ